MWGYAGCRSSSDKSVALLSFLVNAEIIAVGSELLTPSKLDTNSLFLTQRLNELGVEVQQKSIIGDESKLLRDGIAAALQRARILVITGGLGPTEDDLTREALAGALGRSLQYQGEIFDGIVARFQRMGRRVSENNRKQAEVLEGAVVLENPHGTAPGQWVEHAGGVAILLPGPPRELEPMFLNHCMPRLQAMLPPMEIRTLFWRITGMGESQVDALVAPVYKQYQNPVTTILSSLGDIQLHLRARASTGAEAQAMLDEVAARMEPLLGKFLYSKSGQLLEEVIFGELRGRCETVSVAESVTGGMIGARLSDLPGSSQIFLGSLVTYAEELKAGMLEVPREILAEFGAVSAETAKIMAENVRRITGSSWGLATTGYAGPGGGTEENPVGTVFLAVTSPSSGTEVRRLSLLGDRQRVRQLSTQYGLDLLRRAVIGFNFEG